MAFGNVYQERNLPHYTSRKEAGIGKEEPFYTNTWIATIIPPAGVGFPNAGDLLGAQITSIGGMAIDFAAGTVQQVYRGAQRTYAGAFPEQTNLEISCNFNLNQNEGKQLYIYRILKQWNNLIFDPLTGRRGLKADYTGQMIMEYHDRAGDIFKRIKMYDVFITGGLPELGEMVYEGGDILNLEGITFNADYFEDENA